MKRYLIVGAHRKNGKACSQLLYAPNDQVARTVAANRGILVQSVRRAVDDLEETDEEGGGRDAEGSPGGWPYNDNGVERGPVEMVFWVLTMVAVFWVGGCCCVRCTRHTADNMAKQAAIEGSGKYAAIIAQDYVRDTLKSPSSAKFESINRATITRQGSDKYTITSWVDSMNGFGAVIRTRYTVQVRDNGNGKWSLLSHSFN